VRKVAADSTVSTIAGGKSGYRDGVGREAQFRLPMGICMDKESGTIYVSDSGNNCLRVVTPDGVVSTLAGTPGREAEYADGVGVEARFNMPRGIAVDQQGNIIVADSQNFVIRKCTPAGVVTTIAGSAEQNGFADGHGPLARFSGPAGLAIDDQNNIIVADVYNQRIRMIISGTRFVITLVGTGEPGKVDGNGREAQVSYPNGICIGARGEILVTDSNRRCLRYKLSKVLCILTFII
jgi:DNA-binding beta-propeller fold protein YncE